MNVMAVLTFLSVVSAASLEYRGTLASTDVYCIHSEELNCDMEVMLSMPSSLQTGPFPLLVILDGEEYFPTFSGYSDAVSSYGVIPEMIICGVSCSDHFSYYTPTRADIPDGTPVPESGRAPDYLRFLEGELVPALESQFNAAPYTVLFGHSLAGLFTLYSMQCQGGVFEGFIASSPSLWWDSELLTSQLPAAMESGTRLFLSIGNEGETMEDPLFRYVHGLEAAEGIELETMSFPESGHQLVPFKSFIYGVEFIYESWAAWDFNSLESVVTHYSGLSETYGYCVTPPEGILNRLGYRLLAAGREEEAVRSFTANRDYHPGSANVYDSLAEGLLCAGDTAGAVTNYRLSLEIDPENTNAENLLIILQDPRDLMDCRSSDQEGQELIYQGDP